jgi:hypothetical protein
MKKLDKLKNMEQANLMLENRKKSKEVIEEKWYHTLATALTLLASSKGGELKAQVQQDNRQGIEQTTETKAQKEIKEMIKIGEDKSNPMGYGFGTAPNIETAKKIAIFNARKNSGEKGGNINNLTIKGEVLFQNPSGGFEYHILLGR